MAIEINIDASSKENTSNKQNSLATDGTGVKFPTVDAVNGSVPTATQTALDGKQATLVSGTNIKTINGSSVIGSGDLVVGGSSDITIDSTTITSGTDGRILFQKAGKVGQSAGFSRTANGVIDIQATTGFDALKFKSQFSSVGYLGSDNGGAWLSSGAGFAGASYYVGGNSARIRGNDIQFLSVTGVEYARFISSGNLGINQTTPTAKLHVKAVDATSSAVFRVENSAGSGDLFNVQGNGNVSISGDITAPRLKVLVFRDTNNSTWLLDTVTNASNSAINFGNLAIMNSLSLDVKSSGKIIQPNGDYDMQSAGKGFILKTPDGTKSYKITVDNLGTIISTLV